jgi:hypothetical protein
VCVGDSVDVEVKDFNSVNVASRVSSVRAFACFVYELFQIHDDDDDDGASKRIVQDWIGLDCSEGRA